MRHAVNSIDHTMSKHVPIGKIRRNGPRPARNGNAANAKKYGAMNPASVSMRVVLGVGFDA